MCVCVWRGGGGGEGGGYAMRDSGKMTRDCCEKGPFKVVIALSCSDKNQERLSVSSKKPGVVFIKQLKIRF